MDKQNDTEYSQDNWDNAAKTKEPNPNSVVKELGRSEENYRYEIPTHDPQTGESNPHYEELTRHKYPTQEEVIDFNRKEHCKKEMINHPTHYGGEDNTYEAIKVIEAWDLGFNLGNTIKYVSRAGKKLDILEDLEKASWYINREIKKLKIKK